jgi:ATP-binding cassette subfamily F protein 3
VTLVRFSGAGKQFGDRWVLRGVDFQVSAGDRWGIVGRNGVGKTTLFRLLTGADDATEGEIWRHPGIRFTLLRQNAGESSAATVREAALEPFAALLAMEERIEAMAAELGRVDTASPEGGRLLHAYDRDVEEFRRRGGYDAHARAEAALEGLGFPRDTWEKEVRRLSGGELGRLRLAQTLLAEPDVLLLDEPTNHLDLRSTEWLEGFLRAYAGSVMVVSHDRVFLERLADHVLHLEEGDCVRLHRRLRVLSGAAGGAARGAAQAVGEAAGAHRPHRGLHPPQPGRAEDQAGQEPPHAALAHGAGEPPGRRGARHGAALRRGRPQRGHGAQAGRGHRVVRRAAPVRPVLGGGEPRRAGGGRRRQRQRQVHADARPGGGGAAHGGSVLPGAGVRAAYYRQDFTHLRPERRVWEEVLEASPSLPMGELRDHLARFLFRRTRSRRGWATCPGASRRASRSPRITLQRVNLLLMDEPTNHLDIESGRCWRRRWRASRGPWC